ncbi:MAG: metallophosphoesterase, partial [Acidobacteriota bacterium]
MATSRKKTRGFCSLLAILFLLLCSGTAPAGTDKSQRVRLLAFNDFHGQLSPKTVNGRPAGGASVLASYLKNAQSGKKEPTFIVIAGDSIGASPVDSALLQDEPSVMFLNTLANRYCSDRMDPRCNMVATVGNHEFDEGATELKRMLYGGNHAKGPFLEKPYTGAHYPVVAANVMEVATGKPLLKPYVVKKAGNVRIAFIGAVVREAPSMVAPAGVAGLSFIDEADAINRYIPEIKAKGIKAIVAVIHQGGSDVNSLVGRLDGEIDVVVSGH